MAGLTNSPMDDGIRDPIIQPKCKVSDIKCVWNENNKEIRNEESKKKI